MDAKLIAHSLERVAERGDPSAAVYRLLFARHPEMEPLFVRDTTGAVRGNMLAEAIAAILDFTERDLYGGNLFRIEIVNHENLGVPADVFPAFFEAIRDAFADIAGADWSPDIDDAWRTLLARINARLA